MLLISYNSIDNMNMWKTIRKDIDIIGHLHDILKNSEIKKEKVLKHYDNTLDKLELHILKLENEENNRIEEIRLKNEIIENEEREKANREYIERKVESDRLEKIRIELEQKQEEDRKENERIELLDRIEARRKEDLVVMVQCVWRGHSYRRKIRTLAEAAKAILAESHRQLEEKETLEFAIEDELSLKFREYMNEIFELACFDRENEESRKLNWYVRDEIKSIEKEAEKEKQKSSRQRKRKEAPRSKTPKTDELRRKLEAEREAREATLPSFEFIMPGTLEYEHKHHPFRITKPDPNLISSPISSPLSQVRPRPPSQPSISRAQSPAVKSRPNSRPSISPARSPISSFRHRPTESPLGSPLSTVRSRPISPALSTARSNSSSQSKRTKLPPIMKDAETGEDIEFTKAIWSSKEGRVEVSNPRALTSYGTGRFSINPPAMNALNEPYQPMVPYKPYKFNSPNRLVGGRQAGKDAINAFLLEQKYSTPTKAMLEEMTKPPRHELVDIFLREGPLAPKYHKYWDKKTDTVAKRKEALEDGYEPVDEPIEELQEVMSEASSETNATQSMQTVDTESDLWSGSILTEDSNLLAFNDVDDCSVIPTQLALSNKKFWKKVERESYEEIFDIVSKLEWNKKWTNEKKLGSEKIRIICMEIARWKTNNMKLVIASVASEHERDKLRLMAEWKLEEGGKSKRHELAKLKEVHEKERHDKRTFYRNMQYDNEILLVNKLDKYGLIF